MVEEASNTRFQQRPYPASQPHTVRAVRFTGNPARICATTDRAWAQRTPESCSVCGAVPGFRQGRVGPPNITRTIPSTSPSTPVSISSLNSLRWKSRGVNRAWVRVPRGDRPSVGELNEPLPSNAATLRPFILAGEDFFARSTRRWPMSMDSGRSAGTDRAVAPDEVAWRVRRWPKPVRRRWFSCLRTA